MCARIGQQLIFSCNLWMMEVGHISIVFLANSVGLGVLDLSVYLVCLLFIDPYEYHMDLCNELFMSGWRAGQTTGRLAVRLSVNLAWPKL